MLRTSLELFNKPPADLDEVQTRQLQQQVNSQLAIGKRLLEGEAASRIVVPEESIEQALSTLRGEYDSDKDFDNTLEYNQLDRDALREALRYELTVESVLESIMSGAAAVSDEEVEIYYLQHKERFTLPETRTVSHILITINEEYTENSRKSALKRITALHRECDGNGEELKHLAQRHSECPSAMNEGVIGRVKPGQLYASLDKALFNMEEGALSPVTESEIGFHILYCEHVHPAQLVPLKDVEEKVRTLLEKQKRSHHLKQWLHT
jgi:nitrogen fixation protein NifM